MRGGYTCAGPFLFILGTLNADGVPGLVTACMSGRPFFFTFRLLCHIAPMNVQLPPDWFQKSVSIILGCGLWPECPNLFLAPCHRTCCKMTDQTLLVRPGCCFLCIWVEREGWWCSIILACVVSGGTHSTICCSLKKPIIMHNYLCGNPQSLVGEADLAHMHATQGWLSGYISVDPHSSF